MTHNLTIDEGQRQMLLMSLAHLSVERPGFDWALAEIAKPIDNETDTGRPELFDKFRQLHESPFRPIACAPMDGTWIIGRDETVVYPCAFDPVENLWKSPVDFHLVAGVCPQEWKYIL